MLPEQSLHLPAAPAGQLQMPPVRLPMSIPVRRKLLVAGAQHLQVRHSSGNLAAKLELMDLGLACTFLHDHKTLRSSCRALHLQVRSPAGMVIMALHCACFTMVLIFATAKSTCLACSGAGSPRCQAAAPRPSIPTRPTFPGPLQSSSHPSFCDCTGME